ncbi:MAG: 4'-phosphopantetheinyl transferase family protein [Chthoniobacterales bacterium]
MHHNELPICQLYKISPEFWERDVLQIIHVLTGRQLEIKRYPKGKPYFFPHINLDFNVTHTRGIGICAIFSESIGIDCEALDRRVRASALAKRYFSKEEAERILKHDDEEVLKREFLYHWTAKEASLKLIGSGLSGGLDSCIVEWTKCDDEYSQVLHKKGRICLKYLELAPNFLLAVAAWRKFRLAPPVDW